MLFGWDGASYQARPNVALLKREGHSFVIEKVTGEGNYVNPYWSLVRDDARAAGVLFGGYDWVEPQNWAHEADAEYDARDFLRVVGARQPGELLCVDFETPDWASGPLGRDIEAAIRTYLFALRDAFGGKVLVYTARYFLQETGADKWDWLNEENGFILWQAAPGEAAMLPDDAPWPGTPAPFTETTIHQHQWHATSAAVAGAFDRDRFRGTIEELAALGAPGGTGTPTQEGEVIEPAEGKYTAYINAKGNPIFVWNAGGTTPRIDGINVQDLGLSVESATEPGVLLDRSIQGQEVKPWHDRKGQ